ncbi:MAG: putative collagen-binding domain-containing protein [Blastocatellia bacterium]
MSSKALKIARNVVDPRCRVGYAIKEQDTYGIQTYTPPTNGRGSDWVLVLTDVTAGFIAGSSAVKPGLQIGGFETINGDGI